MTCPWCQSDKVYAEFDQAGADRYQVSPWECHACGARQVDPLHLDQVSKSLTPRELELLWHRGWDQRDALEVVPARRRVACVECDLVRAEVNTWRKRLDQQESNFQAARREFQRVADEVSKTNSQLRRSLTQAQQDAAAARTDATLARSQERQLHAETEAELQLQISRLQAEVARLNGLLNSQGPRPAPPATTPTKKDEPTHEGTRFSLLEVD